MLFRDENAWVWFMNLINLHLKKITENIFHPGKCFYLHPVLCLVNWWTGHLEEAYFLPKILSADKLFLICSYNFMADYQDLLHWLCRLNNYTKSLSFVAHHLMNTVKNLNYHMRLFLDLNNLIIAVWKRHSRTSPLQHYPFAKRGIL